MLRETVENKIKQFQFQSGRLWEQVLIPNPADHWSVDREIIGAKCVDHVGWIYRSGMDTDTALQADMEERVPGRTNCRTVLVATGGGGHVNSDYQKVVNAIIEKTRLVLNDSVYFVVARGPRAATSQLFESANEVTDVGSELHSAFVNVDAVISTAGYNSVMEIASSTTPALLIPVRTTFDDQRARTQGWGPKLGHCHSTIEASSNWLVNLIRDYQRRPRD